MKKGIKFKPNEAFFALGTAILKIWTTFMPLVGRYLEVQMSLY
jgi:hypothetical protein